MHPVFASSPISEALPYLLVAAGIACCYHILSVLARQLMPPSRPPRTRAHVAPEPNAEIRKALMELHQALSDLPADPVPNPFAAALMRENLREKLHTQRQELIERAASEADAGLKRRLSRSEAALIRAVEQLRKGAPQELCPAGERI